MKPAVGNYRINFRAINDRIPYAGNNDPTKSNVTKNFLGVLKEGGSNNWNDGWYEEHWGGDKYQPQTANHCIYVYTQIGETEGSDITGKDGYIQNIGVAKMILDGQETSWKPTTPIRDGTTKTSV